MEDDGMAKFSKRKPKMKSATTMVLLMEEKLSSGVSFLSGGAAGRAEGELVLMRGSV
jgi:hypothetical protein